MAEFIPRDVPFAYDPAATAAFARLRSEVGDEVLHDTAAPVKAVVIGGGTGAPVSIRTLLSLEAEVSAVVAMADDGGSTGILREEAGVLPPGDIRKCLAAMAADASDPLTRAFKYRFSFARNHTLGNLMLSALEDATGSFPEASPFASACWVLADTCIPRRSTKCVSSPRHVTACCWRGRPRRANPRRPCIACDSNPTLPCMHMLLRSIRSARPI